MKSPPVPNSKHELIENGTFGLPVEIWEDIFAMASSAPSKNEFGTEGLAHLGVPIGDTIVSSSFSATELEHTIRTRLAITRVCRSWYRFGVKGLYSHIIFKHERSASQIMDFHRTFSGRPDLAAYPRRLHWSTPVAVTSSSWGRIASLTSRLPNLETFTFVKLTSTFPPPWYDHPGEYLSKRRKSQLAEDPRRNQLSSIKVLSIDLGAFTSLPQPKSMVFPSLQTLIVTYYSGGNWDQEEFATMLAFWSFPQLRTLSLGSRHWSQWSDFLQRHAPTIEVLVAGTGHGNLPYNGSRLTLPRLQLLSIYQTVFLNTPTNYMQLDSLKCIAFQHTCEATLRRDPNGYLSPWKLVDAEDRELWPIIRFWKMHPKVLRFQLCGNWEILGTVSEIPAIQAFVAGLPETGAELEFISSGNPRVRRVYRSSADYSQGWT